ncbi:MAG TPA: hypothetical protein VIH54_03660 [Chthoniobacterales bacterium]
MVDQLVTLLFAKYTREVAKALPSTARAGRFQPLREHLASSHEKSPLIACPNRGRRVAPEKPADR